jgi:hypothetical protein
MPNASLQGGDWKKRIDAALEDLVNKITCLSCSVSLI